MGEMEGEDKAWGEGEEEIRYQVKGGGYRLWIAVKGEKRREVRRKLEMMFEMFGTMNDKR